MPKILSFRLVAAFALSLVLALGLVSSAAGLPAPPDPPQRPWITWEVGTPAPGGDGSIVAEPLCASPGIVQTCLWAYLPEGVSAGTLNWYWQTVHPGELTETGSGSVSITNPAGERICLNGYWPGSSGSGVVEIHVGATLDWGDDSDSTYLPAGFDYFWITSMDCTPGEGCTRTPGYWKTHSKYGPAPADATWNLLVPGGPDKPFFLSGQTYYQVLWTQPKGGNAYYTLAHQYVAAVLNNLKGADISDVATAMAGAEGLFDTYTPAQIAQKKGNDPVRKQFLKLAEKLDEYNNGITGPGHCMDNSEACSTP